MNSCSVFIKSSIRQFMGDRGLPHDVCNQWEDSCSGLTERQAAEVRRFVIGDHDVVLGMLERRLDDETQGDSSVRREVVTFCAREETSRRPCIARSCVSPIAAAR